MSHYFWICSSTLRCQAISGSRSAFIPLCYFLSRNLLFKYHLFLLILQIKEDSVSEVMERAAKKGLLKKSSGKKEKRKSVPKEQPPHVANRLSVVDKKKVGRSSPKPQQKKLERQNTEEDGRFKFWIHSLFHPSILYVSPSKTHNDDGTLPTAKMSIKVLHPLKYFVKN